MSRVLIAIFMLAGLSGCGAADDSDSDDGEAVTAVTVAGRTLHFRTDYAFESNPEFIVCDKGLTFYTFTAKDGKCQKVVKTYEGDGGFTLNSDGSFNGSGKETDLNSQERAQAWELNGEKLLCKRHDGGYYDSDGKRTAASEASYSPSVFYVKTAISAPKDLTADNFVAVAFDSQVECEGIFP